MMRCRLFLALAVAVTLTAGCRKEKTTGVDTATVATAGSSAEVSPEKLGELGARVSKNPADASKLIEEHGLTEVSFKEAIRRTTESKDASRRYAAAFRETEKKLAGDS